MIKNPIFGHKVKFSQDSPRDLDEFPVINRINFVFSGKDLFANSSSTFRAKILEWRWFFQAIAAFSVSSPVYFLTMNTPFTIELRLPDDQLNALAALITRNLLNTRSKPYSVAEAAQLTGQSEKTIRRHIEAGRLVSIPNIHKTLIPPSALDRYVHGDEKSF